MHSPDEAADSILDAVCAWSASQQDDLTVMICDYKAGSVIAPTAAPA